MLGYFVIIRVCISDSLYLKLSMNGQNNGFQYIIKCISLLVAIYSQLCTVVPSRLRV